MGLFDSLTKKSAATQTKDQTDLIRFIENKLDDRRYSASRLSKEATWLTNIAYVLGFDQVFYDPRAQSFKQINYKIPLMRSNKVNSNKIISTIQNRVARLCKNPPQWEVPPNSMDDEDKDAARLSEQVLVHEWERLKLNERRINLKMWTEQCGYAFAKVRWDDMEGELTDFDEETEVGIWEGDTAVDIVSPFEIYEDPGAKEWCQVRDIIHARIKHLSYFCDHYENGDLVEQEDVWLTGLQYQQRIEDISAMGGSSSSRSFTLKDSAIEVSYYEKPSRRYPLGRHVVYANGILLKDDILPGHKKRKRIPFVKFDCLPIGGRFSSESIVTHMRPLQDQINRGMTLRAAFANRTLFGKFLAAKGHGLAKTTMIDQSGEIVEYTDLPNHPPPQPLPPPVMPNYAFEEHKLLTMEMYDIAATSEVSRGQLPSAGLPAKGIEILLEADNTRIGIQTEKDEHAYADLGSLILEFNAEYKSTERILKVAGQDSMGYVVSKYKGEDLKEHFDVRCKRGSTVPNSTALKRQEILNAFDRGLLGNPMDPQVQESVYAECEYGDVAATQRPHAIKRAYVKTRILEKIENNETPDTSEFDDHKLIFDMMNEYRMTNKFLKLSPSQKQVFMDTMEEHINHILKLTNPEEASSGDNIPTQSVVAQGLAGSMGGVPPLPPGSQPPPQPAPHLPMGA